jgi:hypothetical protein
MCHLRLLNFRCIYNGLKSIGGAPVNFVTTRVGDIGFQTKDRIFQKFAVDKPIQALLSVRGYR